MKRLQACAFEIVVQVLNALFVTDRRILIRGAGPWLCGICTAIAVYVVKMLGFCVIRFEFVVADRPGGGDSTMMPKLAEVLFSQTKESSAVELRVTTDEIILVRMKHLTFPIAPRFFRVVFAFEIYGARAPVVLFTWNVIAAL